MRFDRLHIPAFGPFTNLDIRFPAQGGDLHVIHGSNEAGKSSLLRAFRDLLFGIHGQSPDNFLHDYKELRIMGEIRNLAGEKLVFQRRKGNKNTLLDAGGNPLPDNVLIPFLGSVDQVYFSTMFGLGSRELREGAEQLLRGEGDIGDALFSASMGGTPVQLVLAALTAESERLFKGRSVANVSIRPAAARHKELLRQSRVAAVNPESWEKIERDLAAAGANKTKLEEDILGFTRNLEWIIRCEDALPTVGRLSEEMRKLEALPVMPEVSGDFVERARAARKATGDASAEVHRLTAQIAKLETHLAGCRISPALLAEAEALDRLHQDLGVHGDRKNTLSDLETELAGLEAALRAGMQNLELTGDLSALETLRLSSAVRLACEEAANDLHKALEERDKHKEKTQDLKTQIEIRETQLKLLPETDLTRLRDALSAAAGATDANKTLSAGKSEVKRLTQETRDRHKELTGAPEDLDGTAGLSVPAKSVIRRVGEEMDGIMREIKTEESRIRDGKTRIESIQAELGRMERRGELPSEQTLRKARDHRDHGWSLVLASLHGQDVQEEFVSGKPLEEAFPQAIVRADDIADQLREQAEAVAQAEEKRFQIAKSEKQNQEAEEKISALQNKLKACQTAWEALWLPCAMTPRAPNEMEEWRETWSEFRGFLRQLRSAEESFQQKSRRIQLAKKELATVLVESGEKGFELLFEKARQRIQQEEESAGRRIEITEQLRALKSQLETFHRNSARVSQSGDAASDKWQSRCQEIGLPEDISPNSGLALLRERKEILTTYDTWKKLTTRAQKTTQAVRQYEQAVNDHCIALGIQGDTTEAQVSRLWDALTKGREAQTRYNQLVGQINEAKSGLTGIQESFACAVQALEELTRLAKLGSVEALEPLLENLELRNQAQCRIATFRDTLSGLARNQTVDDFLSRIRAEDTEALARKKGMLQSWKSEMETSLQVVRDTLSELKSQKQTLEAVGDAAANYRQQAESIAARMKQEAARFVRLRLAVHFLHTQIERFRKENQGPLLEKSGQVFQCITRGAFAGLGAQFNADDVPILVGLRPDQTSVEISGMSDGSRDQLYLALRLAALDRYLEQHEPMPLILDDLLITFDDDRATAILPQLAALARRTQIFLFTHHDHLVELCRRSLGEEAFHLHRLNTCG
ncbi:MAG: AAA family ATPase [Pseudomonadota bacterium]